MAEALDTFSDLDMSDSDDETPHNINKNFNLAANHVKKIISKLDPSKLLEIYGLYKQATEGSCNIQRPKWYEMQAKQKWDAWNSVGDMSSDVAKEKYIKLIEELDPNWNEEKLKGRNSGSKVNSQWVTVSSLHFSEEENVSEADKSVFDFCREGITWKVQLCLESQPELVKKLDTEGLGLIHWAADRGYGEILKLLFQYNCDVSLRDESGQTALHYAASCGHVECINILLDFGADKTLLDEDGLTPLDIAHDDDVKKLLL